MKSVTLLETYICTIFPCALEYGDVTGLTKAEERQLEGWLSYLEDEAKAYDKTPCIYYEYGEESEFEFCDITGMRGNCVAVTAFILV